MFLSNSLTFILFFTVSVVAVDELKYLSATVKSTVKVFVVWSIFPLEYTYVTDGFIKSTSSPFTNSVSSLELSDVSCTNPPATVTLRLPLQFLYDFPDWNVDCSKFESVNT